ncbi:hypothetical protein FALBO_4864 [Fusarium albosuccineum]|uniref:Uncharacterized protein n=1 Tax=Fusarium albosuccineum TaxID=1237068 RepID=A0A8H4LH40_9HYPO|nr:hypothetical protein FALBO_4864 [Fusarium albosuccineum]
MNNRPPTRLRIESRSDDSPVPNWLGPDHGASDQHPDNHSAGAPVTHLFACFENGGTDVPETNTLDANQSFLGAISATELPILRGPWTDEASLNLDDFCQMHRVPISGSFQTEIWRDSTTRSLVSSLLKMARIEYGRSSRAPNESGRFCLLRIHSDNSYYQPDEVPLLYDIGEFDGDAVKDEDEEANGLLRSQVEDYWLSAYPIFAIGILSIRTPHLGAPAKKNFATIPINNTRLHLPIDHPKLLRMVVLPDSQLSPKNCQSLRKHKRQSEQSGDDTQRAPKKAKPDHPQIHPPQFWDNLSQPVLTKNALQELNRRTTTVSSPRSYIDDLRHRPRTRRALAARRETSAPSAQEFLRQSSPADQARVRRFARHGGPSLEDIRGHRCPSRHDMSSSHTSLGRRKRGSHSPDKSNTTTTRSTGPYDRAFQQHLIDHNVFPPGYEYPDGHEPSEPDNIDEIRQVLEQPRASLSPSRFTKDNFKKFRRADDHATKESRVTSSVIPIIEGEPGDTKCVASDIPFTNLDHLTDGSLVYAKPDLYYGARPEQLHKEVRRALDDHIVPSTQEDLPILPNNFVEVKGPDGSLSVATRQALYDVTLGTRGFQSLLSYGATEPCYDNKASALAWTYHGGTLKAYASHMLEPSTPGALPSYAMTQIDSWSLTGNYESFRRGAGAYRNGRDWAKKQRDDAIAQANEKVADLKVAVGPNNVARQIPYGGTTETSSYDANNNVPFTLRYDPETSEDELSLDYERPAKRSCSPEKPASTILPAQEQGSLDQQSKGGLSVSQPNAFRDGRRFKLIPTKLARDKEKIGAKEA